MDQGSTMKRSAVHNFAPTVTKFCVMWEGQALPHDTKFGNSRCEIVGRRVIFIWSLIHGLRWSGLIKAEPCPVRCQSITWDNVDLLSVEITQIYFNQILIKIKKCFPDNIYIQYISLLVQAAINVLRDWFCRSCVRTAICKSCYCCVTTKSLLMDIAVMSQLMILSVVTIAFKGMNWQCVHIIEGIISLAIISRELSVTVMMKPWCRGNVICITSPCVRTLAEYSLHGRLVMRIFDTIFVVSLNKILTKQSNCLWFETYVAPAPYWCGRNQSSWNNITQPMQCEKDL